MRYAIVVSATMAILAQAAPQAIKLAVDGPAFPSDLTAEASSVLATMAEQSPSPSPTDPTDFTDEGDEGDESDEGVEGDDETDVDVTVTADPMTVETVISTTKVKSTVKTTTKKAITTKKVTKKVTKKATKKVTKKKAPAKKNKKGKRAESTAKAAAATTTQAPDAVADAPTTDIGSACAVQPTIQPYYPAAKDDSSFLLDTKINADAEKSALATGYKWVWRNMMKTPQAEQFMGAYSLASYNTSQCATVCNEVEGCRAFNLYYERNPSLNPAEACPNPAPIANIICTVWGQSLDVEQLTNVGQWRSSFAVVIAGSNGYNKV